jgi:transcriptional regulator with XRE-family HTH domain
MENNERQKYLAIGKRIKEARESEGWTQGQLADKVGYQSPTAISLIEAGERKVKISDLELIAKELHQDINYLLTGNQQQATSIRTALRATDKNLDKDDMDKIETFIEFVKSQKKQQDGRGSTSSK